jgi:nucleotide-binding universal stress UspA family protein
VSESECAFRAVDVADALCARVGGELLLLHVVNKVRNGSRDGLPKEMQADLRRDGQQLLGRLSLRVKRSAPPRQLIREGHAGEQILATAAKLKADLLVIGTHGRGGLAHLLLGAATEAVVRQASCPVLTVRHVSNGSRRTGSRARSRKISQ